MIYLIIVFLLIIIVLPKSMINRFITMLHLEIEKIRSKSPFFQARLLINQLSSLATRSGIDQRTMPSLGNYKNYTAFIYQILDYSRTIGGPLKELLNDVRAALVVHFRFDIQVRKIRQAARAQMFLTAAIIWIFAVFAYQSLDMHMNNKLLITFFVLQLSGVLLEQFSVSKIEKKLICPYEKVIFSVLRFKLLTQSGLSVNQALRESLIQQAFLLLPKGAKHFEESFHSILNNWKSYGGSLKDEISRLHEDVQFGLESQLETFKKSCSAVQFFIMITFYFPCFFLLIGSLTQHFSSSL